jgi:Mg-chelatase subunit ChlD
MCPASVKELQIVWSKIFPVRAGVYDIVSYVENPNFGIGAPRVPYVAKLFDANGQVIALRQGETFASPNERFAIFSGNMLTGEKVPAKGSIEIAPGFTWVKTSAPKKEITVSDKVLVGTDRMPKLSALLTSEESDVLRDVEVTAVIYDVTGAPIAVSATTVKKLEPKMRENLFFTWSAPLSYVAETEQCATPVDIALALDRSGSMSSDGKNPPQPLTEAKIAAAHFVDRLTQSDQAAYVSFATVASNPIEQTLTSDIARLKLAIGRTNIGTNGLQYTNIGDALRRSIDELGTFRRHENARPIIVLLTDGIPTRPEDPNNASNKDYPAVYAEQIAQEAKSKDIALYTIGLGDEVQGDFLAQLATGPEYYYKAASGRDLGAIYQQIATAICKKGPSVIEIIPRLNTLTIPTAP